MAPLFRQANLAVFVATIERALLDSCQLLAVVPAERGGKGIPDALETLRQLLGP